MPVKYKCNECGNGLPEDLIDYLEEGNQVFCERCGSPFTLASDKIKKKKIKEDLISPENIIKGQKILIRIILLNFFLVIYFFIFLPIPFNPYVIIIMNANILNLLKSIGIIIFILILVIGFLEIGRGCKLFMNKGYGSQILMVNTIGQVLLREVLYPPSREENLKSDGNEIEALKILIPFVYVNFFWANFYYSLPFNFMSFLLEISFFLFIYIIVYVYHLCIGFIILLEVKKLGYRFLKGSSLVQLIFYNSIILLTIGTYFKSTYLNNYFIFIYLFLDIIFIYFTIRITKNKDVLMQYLSPKNRICHKCGSEMKKGILNCPKCVEDLSKGEFDLEKVSVKKIEEPLLPNKEIHEPEVIIAKGSEAEENREGSEYSEELSFITNEKDKKLLGRYLLERFVVVSEQTRKSINKLNLSREEKIDLVREFSFLTKKEQQNLLDLLVHLCND